MVAAEIMTKKLKTVLPSMPTRELANFLINEHISGVPVVDKTGKFLGIVTEEDLIFQDKKVQSPTFLNLFSNILPLGLDELEKEIKKIAGTKVKDLMQQNPAVIHKDMPIEEIATLMTEKKVYYLPVLEENEVIGVITKRDLIRAVATGKIW